jgi:hypothetical protein
VETSSSCARTVGWFSCEVLDGGAGARQAAEMRLGMVADIA